MKVVVSPRVEHELEAIDRWWRANRRDATFTVYEEMERAIGLLARLPAAYPTVPGTRALRRYLLRGTSHWLYYRIDGEHVRLLHVLHTRRRRPRGL